MNHKEIRKYTLYSLLTCLFSCAIVASISVIAGGINELAWQAIASLVILTIHAIILINISEHVFPEPKSKQSRPAFTDDNQIPITNYAFFVALTVSIPLSLGALWGASGEVITKLYGSIIIIAFAILHSELIYNVRNTSTITKIMAVLNWVLITVIAIMLQMLIWTDVSMHEVFVRSVLALAILDITLSIAISLVHHAQKPARPAPSNPAMGMPTNHPANNNTNSQPPSPNDPKIS